MNQNSDKTIFRLPEDYVNINPNITKRILGDINNDNNFHYLFLGPVGCGKTYLAELIYNFMKRNDVKTKYIKAREIYREYVEKMMSDVSDKADALRKRLQCLRGEFVVLDDLGDEKPRTEKSIAFMQDIITDRYEWIKNRDCKTIIITNLTGEEIGKTYGYRVLDRLHECFTVMKFKDHSFRSQNVEIIEG